MAKDVRSGNNEIIPRKPKPLCSMARIVLCLAAYLTLSACELAKDFYNEVIVESVNEVIVDPINNAELSYCAGCDWIIQQYHEGWSTHNSTPYETESDCVAAKREKQDRHPDTIFRCVHESQLH